MIVTKQPPPHEVQEENKLKTLKILGETQMVV